MTDPASPRALDARPPKLLFLVTEDWYFCSHRLAIARAAKAKGYEVVVATRVRDHGPVMEAEGFRVTTGLADHDTLLGWLHLDAFHDSTDGVTGTQAWSFSAADHYFDYLAEGETVTLTYSVEVDDHHGGTVAQDVVVTVTGSNDAPELAADVSGESAPGLHSIQERPGLTGDTADLDLAGGSLAFVDLDLSDSHKVSSSAPGFVWLDKDGEPLSLTDAQQSAACSRGSGTCRSMTVCSSASSGIAPSGVRTIGALKSPNWSS